ncbi:hypothetical protein [Nonomuraea dietziae]
MPATCTITSGEVGVETDVTVGGAAEPLIGRGAARGSGVGLERQT